MNNRFEYVELGNFLEPPECKIEVDWTKTHGSGCICILPTVHLMYKNICTFPDNSFTFVTPERQNNRMPKHTNDIKDIPPPRIPSLLLFQTSFGFIYRRRITKMCNGPSCCNRSLHFNNNTPSSLFTAFVALYH